MMKKTIHSLFIFVLLPILFSVCSKLKKDQPTEPQTDIQSHQTGWLDTLSTNFHGKYIRSQGWDLSLCYKCHGNDYAGGTSNKSCKIEGCHPSTPEACTTCHGGLLNQTGAPPKDINNNINKAFKGVGAHTIHITDSKWGKALDCNSCHIKPQKLNDSGHIDSDLPAEIVWGEFAKADNLSPVYQDSSCSNVYCHGGSLTGGTLTTPVWTQSESLSCNSCHGLPPLTGAHKAHAVEMQFDCVLCHDGYSKDSATNKEVHIDGKKDVQFAAAVGGNFSNGVCSNVICHGSNLTPSWTGDLELTCTSCHGGLDNATGAPPYDLKGNTATTAKGVGAHTIHVMGGSLRNGMDCTECHAKPHEVADSGHIGSDLLPAEITWGDLAKMDNASPSWDGVNTCSDVYCHGEFERGNKFVNPIWTQVYGTQTACGTCHKLPPDLPHPELSTCSLCHPSVVDDSLNIIGKDKHINGQTDF